MYERHCGPDWSFWGGPLLAHPYCTRPLSGVSIQSMWSYTLWHGVQSALPTCCEWQRITYTTSIPCSMTVHCEAFCSTWNWHYFEKLLCCVTCFDKSVLYARTESVNKLQLRILKFFILRIFFRSVYSVFISPTKCSIFIVIVISLTCFIFKTSWKLVLKLAFCSPWRWYTCTEICGRYASNT
jgi:hypothetical protein